MKRWLAVVALFTICSWACSGSSTAPNPNPQGQPDGGGGGGGGGNGGVGSTRPASVATQWWNGAVVYEVFVRSFSDASGDGNGDLAGLTAKLDYLNDGDPSTTSDLGVDAIWLMPIYPSPSYHGYDVTDYGAVNPQ